MSGPPRPGAAAGASRPDMGWQDRAACVGTVLTLWFGPDDETPEQRQEREADAKDVCSACPVRWKCGTYAVSTPIQFGVWGGTGEAERAQIRRNYLRRQREYTT